MRTQILLTFLLLTSLPIFAADATPAPPKETVETNCESMGGEYFEDGDDFYGCELPSGTTVACIDWYGCIAWKESVPPGRVVRDHRLKAKFGTLNVRQKNEALQRNAPIARKVATFSRG